MFNETIKNYKKIIDENIVSVYNTGPALINEPINYILSGGKRIRPILCLLSFFSSSSSKNINDDLLKVSLSIELLHNFTLIHDDIMDEDDLRHGKPTIHNRWNSSIAILSGDAMLSVALTNLNSIKHKNKDQIIAKFHNALIEVCEGQALDIFYQSKDNVSIDEYILMIDKKTAYMIALSSELGAILSDSDSNTVRQLKEYGHLLGRGFQIQDDLMEIISTSNKMGKSLKSDFLLNKKTFPYLIAKEMNQSKIDEILKITPNDYDLGYKLFKDFLNDENIISETKKYIKNTLENADLILKNININKDYLLNYSKMILGRDK